MLDGLTAVFLKLTQAEVALGDQLGSLLGEFGIELSEVEVAVAYNWWLKVAALDEL